MLCAICFLEKHFLHLIDFLFIIFIAGNSLHGIPAGGGYGSMNSPGMYGDPMGPQAHQTMNVTHPHQGSDGHGGLMDLSQTPTSSMSSKQLMDTITTQVSQMPGGQPIEPLTPEESDGIAVQ